MSALPNILTVLRLVAVPVMVALFIADAGEQGALRGLSLAVFVVAAATDVLDGYLARRWKVVSDFGKLWDPIADKALVLTALGMLAASGDVPWWPVLIIAAREVGVTLGRLAVAQDTVIPASPGGKLKTVLQMLAVFLFMWPAATGVVDTVAWWVLIAAAVLALATGVDYAVKISQALQRQRARTRSRADEPA